MNAIKFLFETRKETSYKLQRIIYSDSKSLSILEIGYMGASFGIHIFWKKYIKQISIFKVFLMKMFFYTQDTIIAPGYDTLR